MLQIGSFKKNSCSSKNWLIVEICWVQNAVPLQLTTWHTTDDFTIHLRRSSFPLRSSMELQTFSLCVFWLDVKQRCHSYKQPSVSGVWGNEAFSCRPSQCITYVTCYKLPAAWGFVYSWMSLYIKTLSLFYSSVNLYLSHGHKWWVQCECYAVNETLVHWLELKITPSPTSTPWFIC